jgi:hypothetical protein
MEGCAVKSEYNLVVDTRVFICMSFDGAML